MMSEIRGSILLLTLAKILSIWTPFITKRGLSAPNTRMDPTLSCSRQDFSASFVDNLNERSTIDVGSFKDPEKSPFEIVVHKKDLIADGKFKILAEGNISTGYTWMCIDVLSYHEHNPVASAPREYYKDRLTKDILMDVSRNGVSAHGISVSSFSTHRTNTVTTHASYLVGRKEMMEASLTVSKDISEGNYFVEIAYGSPFRSTEIVAFREILVKVLP